MTKYIAKEIIEKYINGTCTAEEKAIVESWHLKELADKSFRAEPGQLESAYAGIWEGINLKADEHRIHQLKKVRRHRYLSAAAVLLICATAFFFIRKAIAPVPIRELLVKAGKDFRPGGNKAILTLADGSKISLTDAKDGKLGQQAGISITKTKDGQLIYKVESTASVPTTSAQPLFNTISTPRGGKYQVQLPDGTIVWLNAASSLKYPVQFDEKQRLVSMQGEAYFEVAKNQRPFIVKSGQQEVEVLGTHFNINSYADEQSIKTTLVEGRVKVRQVSGTAANSVILNPGEHSIMDHGKSLDVQKADIENELAWKNDLFNFKDESIESITRKLSRWYDVEFNVEGTPKNLSYVGIVSRSRNISSVLSVIEGAGNVHFKIDGRRITISYL